MERYFSDKTERGIELVWMQYDQLKCSEGRRLLEEAAEAGDADALCFLGRTYMGYQYVWRHSGLSEDEALGEAMMRDSIAMGSACGVLIGIRCGVLTPQVQATMPFNSLEEAWDIVYKKAEAGHPYCQYIIGNTYFWWDFFGIKGIDPIEKYQSKKKANQVTAKLAEEWFERAVAGGLSNALDNLQALYEGAIGYKGDKKKRREITRRGAEAGFPYTMYVYGWDLYRQGKFAEAYEYVRRASDMGQVEANVLYGHFLLRGKGMKRDEKAGLALLLAAQEAEAEEYKKTGERLMSWREGALLYEELGAVYAEGRIVEKDEEKALVFYKAAPPTVHSIFKAQQLRIKGLFSSHK